MTLVIPKPNKLKRTYAASQATVILSKNSFSKLKYLLCDIKNNVGKIKPEQLLQKLSTAVSMTKLMSLRKPEKSGD